MPTVRCKCGGTTNTAVSVVDDFMDWGEKADRCYAKYENGKWVKGCAEPDIYAKNMFQNMLKNEEPQSVEWRSQEK